MSKLRDGFRVIGPDDVRALHVWYFQTLEQANAFAQQMTQDDGYEYDVCQYLGSWAPAKRPVQFIAADRPAEPATEQKT